MRFTHLLFSMLALFLSTSVFGNRIYLSYDTGCMDVYEYQLSGGKNNSTQLVYHIKLNDREKVILEADYDQDVSLSKKPSKIRSCSDLSINERTVRQINNGELNLYIVRKNGTMFNVTAVNKASYAQISNNSTGYSTSTARFSYKFTQPANGIDLASNSSNASIYFKGKLSHECPKKYLFTESSTSGDKKFREFVLIPEIGVIEEKSGRNENNAKNIRKLTRINGQNTSDYIRNYCSRANNNGIFHSGNTGTVDSHTGTGTNDNGFDPFTRQSGGQGTTTTTNTNPPVTNTNTTPGKSTGGTGTTCTIYKDLDKGLYFDWQTGQLANGRCGGNTYTNGYMTGGPTVVTNPAPTTTTRPVPPTTTTRPVPQVQPDPVPYNECGYSSRYGVHVVQRSETLYGIARSYGLSINDLQKWNRLSSKSLIKPCMQLLTRAPEQEAAPIQTDYASQSHTVQRNETLYGIARKHGYTVDRIRKMNGLTNSDKIYVGQQLKVADCNCPADNGQPIAYAGKNNTPTAYEAAGERIKTGTVTSSARRNFHVVKENDTIYSIAKKHNISVARLRVVNDLEENEIIIPYQRIYLEN